MQNWRLRKFSDVKKCTRPSGRSIFMRRKSVLARLSFYNSAPLNLLLNSSGTIVTYYLANNFCAVERKSQSKIDIFI